MQIEEIIQGKKGKLIIRAEGGLSFPLYEKEAAKYRLTEGVNTTPTLQINTPRNAAGLMPTKRGITKRWAIARYR